MNLNFRKTAIVVVGFLFFMVAIYLLLPTVEGLGQEEQKIGKYDYLKPPFTVDSAGNMLPIEPWSNETLTNVTATLNNNIPQSKPIQRDQLVGWHLLATETEAKFYIQNKRWPYPGYITDKMMNDTSLKIVDVKLDDSHILKKEAIIAGKAFPTRLLYNIYFVNTESAISPLPITYKIFQGTVDPPSDGESAGSNLTEAEKSTLKGIISKL